MSPQGRPTRREVLRGAALGAALASPPLVALACRRPAGPAPRPTLVLGAGLAGLSAAFELVRAGGEVTVLEGRMRAGGRVHTLREPFADGLYAEAGAMYAGGPRTRGYVRELGLRLVPPVRARGAFVYHVRGKRLRVQPGGRPEWPVELEASERGLGVRELAVHHLAADLEDVGDPLAEDWPPESARRIDAQSYAALLAERGASAGALELIRLDVGDLFGEGIETVSALRLMTEMAIYAVHPHHGGGVFDGGSDRLPAAFAERLGTRVRYGCAVKRVEVRDGRVGVVCERAGRLERHEAERVVCTIPAPVVGDVEFDPPLSAEKRAALARVRSSSITRTYVQTRRRFWEDAGDAGPAYGDLPVPRVLVHPLARGTHRGILEAHCGKGEARRLAALSEAERVEAALESLERMHPGTREHFEGGVSWSWVDDPWTRGGYTSFGPGEVFGLRPALAASEGRVHFAGEHTSRLSASMEGALESGQRAAREVAEA